MSTLPQVLIINSDPGIRALLRWLLRLHSEQVFEAAGSVEIPALVRELRPTVVVMDPRLHGLCGEVLMVRIQKASPGLPVVVYTDPTTAMRAPDLPGVTTVVVHGQHQLSVLLVAVQRAHAELLTHMDMATTAGRR